MKRDDETDPQLSVVRHDEVGDGQESVHDPDEHDKLVAEAFRHLADQQLDRAERVRAAGRQTFVYVSAFFAVGQAVAFSSFGSTDISDDALTWIIGFGIVAVVLVAVTGILAIIADQLRSAADASADDFARAADEAVDDDEHVSRYFTRLYAANVNARAEASKTRARFSNAVNFCAMLTVAFVLFEILASLIARLP